jgi:hypothetical protein
MSRTWKDSPLGSRIPRQGEVERRESARPLLYVLPDEFAELRPVRVNQEIACACACTSCMRGFPGAA